MGRWKVLSKPSLLHCMIWEVRFEQGREVNMLEVRLAWILITTLLASWLWERRDHVEDPPQKTLRWGWYYWESFECLSNTWWVLSSVFLKTELIQLGNNVLLKRKVSGRIPKSLVSGCSFFVQDLLCLRKCYQAIFLMDSECSVGITVRINFRETVILMKACQAALCTSSLLKSTFSIAFLTCVVMCWNLWIFFFLLG